MGFEVELRCFASIQRIHRIRTVIRRIRHSIRKLRATAVVRYPLFLSAIAGWLLCYSLAAGTTRDVLGWVAFGVVLVTAPIGPVFWAIRGSAPLRWIALMVGAALLIVSVFFVDEGAWSPVLGWLGAFLVISTLPDENLGLRGGDDTA
jgi:hypothetical protein